MKERIRQVMEYAKLSQQDFAAKLGISPASLSSIYTGRTNPTNNHVQAVHRAFPEVNINWLLFGEGEMFGGAQPGVVPEEGLELVMGDLPLAQSSVGSGMPGGLFGQMAPAPGQAAEASGRAGDSGAFPGVGYGAGQAENRVPQKVSGTHRETAAPRRAEAPTGGYVKETPRPVRKVKEIRVFFDDGTYESFVPSVK